MNNSEKTSPEGQAPIDGFATVWLVLLILLWAANSVVVKLTVRDFAPLWAAFLRFSPAVVFVGILARYNRAPLALSPRRLLPIAGLGALLFLQILLFNFGSQFTTGGRVTLFIFTYPLMVPWFSAMMMKQENLRGRVVLGTAIAFAGVAFALRTSLTTTGTTLRGDLLELASAVLIALGVALSKRTMYRVNKWAVLFWRFTVAVTLFLACALLFDELTLGRVQPDAWLALGFQIVVVSMFCFASFQYLLSRHNSSTVAVFFFATPLAGMLIGMLLLDEPFDPALLIGGGMVGAGILVVNNPFRRREER